MREWRKKERERNWWEERRQVSLLTTRKPLALSSNSSAVEASLLAAPLHSNLKCALSLSLSPPLSLSFSRCVHASSFCWSHVITTCLAIQCRVFTFSCIFSTSLGNFYVFALIQVGYDETLATPVHWSTREKERETDKAFSSNEHLAAKSFSVPWMADCKGFNHDSTLAQFFLAMRGKKHKIIIDSFHFYSFIFTPTLITVDEWQQWL